MPFHHVAYVTRDVEATTHFYADLMGFPLVNTELQGTADNWVRHVFYDIGGGESIAFFQIQDVGERADYATDVSDSVGLPVWTNHAAFRATADKQEEVRERMDAEGIKPLMELDHGWCHSLYYVDPNGIMVELCRDEPGLPIDTDEADRLMRVDPRVALAAPVVAEG
jgi:catechol 2,3-dioxygenase-like lactoylglutathione lyase family enzyme